MQSCSEGELPLMPQLTDTVTSLALSTMGIAAPTGVSVNISTEFVRPGGREGDNLYGIGEVTKLGKLQAPYHPGRPRAWGTLDDADKQGKTLAYTRVTFYDAQDRVVAYGSHTKHMGANQPSTAFSADGEEEIPLEPRAKL